MEGFVIDFYCREKKIAIEIDGSIHEIEGGKEYDTQRQAIIEKYGIKFIRFSNDEIKESLNQVIKRIKEAANSK